MLKKSIASLVLSMVMLASGSVFSFSDTGVKNHADGKERLLRLAVRLFPLIESGKSCHHLDQDSVESSRLFPNF